MASRHGVLVRFTCCIILISAVRVKGELNPTVDPDLPSCSRPLGMESGAIPDASITTSSVWQHNHELFRGRLHGDAGVGAWVVHHNFRYHYPYTEQWLQVDLGEVNRITGTIIQGRHTFDQWVEAYKLQYSTDGASWTTYVGSDGSEMVFPGNTDDITPVTNLLDNPVDARYVRFVVQKWHTTIAMRAEVLGCNITSCSKHVEGGTLTWDLPKVNSSPFIFEIKVNTTSGTSNAFGLIFLYPWNDDTTLTQNDNYDNLNPLNLDGYRVKLKSGTSRMKRITSDGGRDNVANYHSADLTSAEEFRGFWICWSKGGSVGVGRAGEVEPFMSWTDRHPITDIGRVGYGTEGVPGDFMFNCNQAGFPGVCVDPPTQANTTGPKCDCPYLLGENCTYPCSPGYHVISGDVIVRTCAADGSWTNPDQFCQDIDECSTLNGGCSQTCNNTVGSYNCSCNEGFVLDGDGHNCTACCSIKRRTDGSAPLIRDLPKVTSSPFIFEVKVNTSGATVIIRLDTPENNGYRMEIKSGRSSAGRVGRSRYGVARVDTTDMTSADEFRRFWICWSKGGSFGVGRAGEVEPFMSWTDRQPFIGDISRTGYDTAKNAVGDFMFNCTQAGFPGVCVDPPTQANTTGPVCDCPYLLGENCTYPCSPGYHVISGDVITRTCRADGSWTGPDLFCQGHLHAHGSHRAFNNNKINYNSSANCNAYYISCSIKQLVPDPTTDQHSSSDGHFHRVYCRSDAYKLNNNHVDGDSSDYLDDEASSTSGMTTLPTLPPNTAESTPQPPVVITTQESSTHAPFLIEEEIPGLIKTLREKVNGFSGSQDNRKELLKEVTDASSSVLRAQSSSREAVAMETTIDLSSGVTDGLEKLIDVQSTDRSPIEQLIQKKKEQERLKSRVIGETRDLLEVLDAAADKLLEETPPEGEVTHIRSDGVLTTVKKSIPDVDIVPISQDVGSIVFTKEDNLPEDSTMKVVAFVEDPFVWSVRKVEASSSVIMVTITKDGDDQYSNTDASNLQTNITVIVKHGVQLGITSDSEDQYHDTLPTSYRQNLDDAGRSFPRTKVPSHDANMKYHAMYIADGGQVPLLRFSVDDVDTELQVYFRFHDFPTEKEYDYTTTVKPPEVADYDGFNMPFGLVYSDFNKSFIPEIQMERGWLMVGVKRKGGDLPHGGLRRLLTSAVPQTPPPPGRDGSPAGFTLQTAAVSCLMRGNEDQTWDNRRCQVGVETNETTTRCTCDMTPQSDGKSSRVILAASFVALPNFVHFDKFGTNIDKLSTNSTVFGTIVALWMIFLMSQLLILHSNIRSHIAISTAVADSLALGHSAKLAKAHPGMAVVPKVSTITSEVPGADYVYVVSVRTGTQPDAGTASVVGLMITGLEGRTAMVTLNPEGLILARGGDSYHIMTTPASIGKLQSVQVWHDSSGKGAMESLFIDSIKVWDIQTEQGCCFPCYTWLSSSKGDGRTIRTLKAAPDGEMRMFEYALPTFSYLLYDDHLLLSAVYNSGVRHFSRAQRLVCSLTQTTLWMVGSAMWYGVKLGAQDVILFDAGVITLRLSELIGTAATSFTVFLPVYAILVPMFRKQHPLEDQIPSGLLKTATSPSSCRFPYKTVAWILAILTSVSSSFFVIMYSLQFGAEGSQAWLKDFVLTFLFSTFLLEPVQIFMIAYTKAVIIGPIMWSVTACVGTVFGTNLSDKDRSPVGAIQRKGRDYDVPARRVLPPAPKKSDHDPNWTERMTKGRSILVVLVYLLIFTGNAFYIGVLGFDRHAYYIRTSLENSLLSGNEEVTTVDDAWEWLSSELMPSLHPERGYSGQKLRWLDKQFPVGTNAFRIGPVRLERTTKYPGNPIDIDLEHSNQRLYPELFMNLRNEALGRQSGRNCSQNGTTSIVDELRNGTSACYTTVDLPRDAGQAAAVIEFLKRTNWILMVSDTLVIRINFYHPDVKLFSTVVFRLQYTPGGAAYLQPSIQTFRLFQYQTADDFVQMLFHILFVLFFIYNVLNEIWNIRKRCRLYFSSFWNILILCNIGLSTAVIVTFALRYINAASAFGDLKQATGLLGINEFVNISTASQWDATFKEVLSFSIFISTCSILRVLNFSRGVATIYALPRLIYGEAFGYAVYMLVVIVAYGLSGILIFGKHMESFSGFKKTSYVLFEMGLGRPFVGVFADDMKAVDRVMGPLYYSTFVMLFVFYLMNLGVGMLCNWMSYCETSDDIGVDTAMGDYFWNSFRSLLGMRHQSQDFDDESPLPNHFLDETLQRTDTVLQEVDRVTDLMYKFECKKRQLTHVQPGTSRDLV
ncbi:uncharacterized protein [Branchiostoma lanceolatum]|uniref:uncharacterized protein n=1 Tax=Branchiostoma lanceolatum TaxID=7740 RepID=UPI003457010E